MTTVNYKISEKNVVGLGSEFLTIDAIKENKIIKSISFYKTVSTCLGDEKMSYTGLGSVLNSKIGFEGEAMNISEKAVKEILEIAKTKNIETLVK